MQLVTTTMMATARWTTPSMKIATTRRTMTYGVMDDNVGET
jgi:hypothetical protein